MASAQTIKGQRRDIKTKGYLNQLKRDEYVPGVVYGKEQDVIPVSIGARHLNKVFNTYGMRGIFSLEIEGENKPYNVIVREMQRTPLNGKVTHIDFMTINMQERLNSTVPIFVDGEEELVKKGGILQMGAKEVEVECLPQDLPEYITCYVSALNVGDKVTIGDLTAPQGVEITSDPASVVVSVLAPRVPAGDETAELSEAQAEGEGTEQVAEE